jgi:hypothetical protein
VRKDTGHKIYTGSGCQGGEPYVLFGGSSMAPYSCVTPQVFSRVYQPNDPVNRVYFGQTTVNLGHHLETFTNNP